MRDDDPLVTYRGVLTGLALGLIFWVLIVGLSLLLADL